MKHRTLALWALVLATCLPIPSFAAPDDAVVTVDEVLAMMDRAPAHELGKAPYKWSKVGQANRIAWSISRSAKTREEAAELTIYSVFEGGNRIAAVGDGGKSFGAWQISSKRAPPEVAQDPDKAAPIWLSLAAASRAHCAALPPDEQLAELASGNCSAGHVLVRRRARLVLRVLALPSE